MVTESRFGPWVRLEFPDGSAIVGTDAGSDRAPHVTRLDEAAAALARYSPAGTEGLSREERARFDRSEAPFLWCRTCFESARARLWLPKGPDSAEGPPDGRSG